ncbi:MAG TPA: DUF58 domain-containing protein [Candidatus Thermoplasmatota archaeon]|nr:DUF58 domain-containing protein [Candidatus Thermoplasmatota archaeon]
MPEKRNDADPRGLTAFGRSVAFAGALLLFLGLAFGNYPYLLCALLLLGVALWARLTPAPRLDVARAVSADDVRAGDPVDVDVVVQNSGAAAAVALHDRVPDVFLLDDGSNFDAAWLPTGEGASLRYRLRAPRRGVHELGGLRATSFDPLFLQTAPVAEVDARTELVAHPRTPPVPRIKTGSAWGRTHLPGGDKASRGILTNDFRELRPYARGDPLKSVNWKATARQSREGLELIVNDYEVEGKKVIWLFADASAYTVGGTTLQNAFDELAAATLAVAGHYLDMGHRVGLTLWGAGGPRVLYADGGDLQERRIAAALATADPGQPGDGVHAAVEATKGFLARERPLLFVFTLAGRDPELPRALATARALASTGRRAAPVVVVTPILEEPPLPAPHVPRFRKKAQPPRVDPALAARVVAIHERAALKGLERRGVTVVRYHPTRTPLAALLARGMMR